MKRIGVIAILILAFCGLSDATYLAEHVASNTPVICNVQGLSDCNTVIASQYSHLFGIPLADLGVLFYGVLFILAALELLLFDAFLRRVLQVASLIGVLASVYFVSLQAFVIRAFCIYCLTSAIITLLVLIVASFIEPMKTRIKTEPVPMISPPPRLTMPPPAS
jgi:uncharacterized membrane protein